MSLCAKRAAVFLLGFCAVVAQVSFFREFLVVFLGNELCAGVVFFSWFVGVGLGAAASARPARRTAEGETWFVPLATALACLAPVLLVLIRLSRGILGVPPGAYIPFSTLLLSSVALVAPFSFLVGSAFPFACLIPLGRGRGVGSVGRAYVVESLGSIAGGAAFSFVLAGRVPAVPLLSGCAAALCLAVCLASRGRPRGARWTAGACAAAWGIALLSGAAGRVDSWSVARRWRGMNPALPLVASVDSRYENIAVGGRAGQYDVFGSGQYYFSFPDPYGAGASAHMVMTGHPSPGRVLLVGGGVGGMLPAMLRHRPSLIEYVELDPALIGAVEPLLDAETVRALRDPAVRVVYGDGRRHIKRAEGRYDLVVVNTPDPSTAMLNRFYTREFYREVRRVLAPGGVLAARLSAPADYYGGEVGDYAGSVCATLRAVFPYVVVAPGEENRFFASADPDAVTADLAVLTRRWEERGVETPSFSAHHLTSWWLPARVEFTRRALEARAGGRVNTDLRPVTYYYDLILWSRFSGSSIAGALKALARAGPAWYLGPPLALWALRLLWLLLRRRPPRSPQSNLRGWTGWPLTGARQDAFHALLAMGAVGFSAMALELVLVFAFQNVYGYVYAMLGLIVALFMAGLACGGHAATRFGARAGARCLPALAAAMGALALHAAAVPWAVRFVATLPAESEYVFLALVWLTGALTGAAFPLAAGVCLRHDDRTGAAAARVNGFDNAGACAGALLAGVVLVPLLGLASTCLVVAALDAASAALLLAGCAPHGARRAA